MGSSPPKKRRRQNHPSSAQSPPPLIPLESGLQDNPDPHKGLEESFTDSSESEVSLSGESAAREPTAEPVLQPSKTLDISLNFRLEHSGTQVMVQYSRAKPPPAVESSLVISRHLALRLTSS